MLNLSHRSEPSYDFLALIRSFKGREGNHSIMPQAQQTGCDHSTAEDFLTSQDLQLGARFFMRLRPHNAISRTGAGS